MMTKERIEDIRQSVIPFVKKELLEINNDGLGESDAKEFEKDLNEVLDLAIKALEQEPCEDCISRAEVMTEIQLNAKRYSLAKESGGLGQVVWSHNLISINDAIEVIRTLPSVTPTPKTGHWIVTMDCEGKTRKCTCDKCGYETGKYTWHNPNYCPNCGARMESEVGR